MTPGRSSIDEDYVATFPIMDNVTTEPEWTIRTMENSGICADSRHFHSFQTTSFMLTAALRKCIACEKRIHPVLFPTSDSSRQIVKCIACGAYAHRVCTANQHMRWKETCPVNRSLIDFQSASSPARNSRSISESDALQDETKGESADEEALLLMEWTSNGPPNHWANGKPKSMVPTITIPTSSNDSNAHNTDEVYVTPPHHADHPFASVSRALQENIMAHFRPKNTASDIEDKEWDTSVTEALSLKAKQREEEKDNDEGNPLMKLASGTIQAVRTTVNLPARLGMATFAGGIAGGFAGLALAGPAGAYAGYKLGQTASVLGVVLEGSVSIGIVVASVATASYTAKQIQDHMDERRVLTMGEEGTSRKVLLVRPNIHVDPVWEDIYKEAKRNSPDPKRGFFLLSSEKNPARERYQRDSDIVQPTEEEIPTTEKVLLLASRILNDKSSVPGYVYRSLIETFKERCKEDVCAVDGVPCRRRRDDAHAVIKHVTASLLEERPGFGHTAALTELTATAVEGFVFGQIYDVVFEEIRHEAYPKDAHLTEKIADFQRTQANTLISLPTGISDEALNALRQVPTFSTAVEKLRCCTIFLEKISAHFSRTDDNNSVLSADSLLKMVCQHVVAVQLASINTEIAFVEEFARDEQLLRGREGYALATLQAALHFLNMSSNLENDIFKQDDEERNVPIQQSGTSEAKVKIGSAMGSSASLDSSVEFV